LHILSEMDRVLAWLAPTSDVCELEATMAFTDGMPTCILATSLIAIHISVAGEALEILNGVHVVPLVQIFGHVSTLLMSRTEDVRSR
jgi:hypothetical protein